MWMWMWQPKLKTQTQTSKKSKIHIQHPTQKSNYFWMSKIKKYNFNKNFEVLCIIIHTTFNSDALKACHKVNSHFSTYFSI